MLVGHLKYNPVVWEEEQEGGSNPWSPGAGPQHSSQPWKFGFGTDQVTHDAQAKAVTVDSHF